ncbi:MAG: IS630 transposase-related protein [Wolbachia pipientis]|nr:MULTISPECIES: IS630 transposase-related protein [unclassified Wolbachia]
MQKPYSEDLREKVLKVFDAGEMTIIKKVCETFNIDEKTLYWWRKRKEETGSVKPASGYQKGHGHKTKDLDSFNQLYFAIL